MRKTLLTATLLAGFAAPSAVSAQQTCEQLSGQQAVGTVAGAGVGAVLGSAIAGHGDKTLGAIIGAVGGGVLGNQIAKPNADCSHAYGYYDRSNVWHATNVRADAATGYYDRNGTWVEGAPRGYYDSNNRWIAASTDTNRAGYRDEHGHWVPASVNGYYDADNRYVGGAVSGYYDRDGRWVPGSTVGRYDRDGRWIAGAAAGHRDADGRWIADAQPGYYDNGRWRQGTVYGYYDTNGSWVRTGDIQTGYGDARPIDGRRDLASRELRIQQRIEDGYSRQQLSYRERNRALTELASIKRSHRQMSDRYGRMSARSEQYLQSRLDRLSDMVRMSRQDDQNG